jgi:thioredoxin 1
VRRRRRIKALAVERLSELRRLAADGTPVLIDFWQAGCQPCRTMDGIIDELAAEFDGRAHVVKVDVRRAPEAAAEFRIQSTPTFVVLAASQKKPSKKAKQRSAATGRPAAPRPGPRWRSSGLVRKDVLAAALVSNGAAPLSTQRDRPLS